jgi:hypothetical protein
MSIISASGKAYQHNYNQNILFFLLLFCTLMPLAGQNSENDILSNKKHTADIKELLKTAWENSSEAKQVKAAYAEACITYNLQNLDRYPQFSIYLPQTIMPSSGANTYILGQSVTQEGHALLKSAAGVNLKQKLPGDGSISVGTSYTMSKVWDQANYLQGPSISLEIQQPLGPGAFSSNDDPDKKKAQLSLEKAEIEYNSACASFMLHVIGILKTQNVAALSCQYYEMSQKSCEETHEENELHKKQERISAVKYWESERALLSAERNTAKARFELDAAIASCTSLLGVDSTNISITSEALDDFTKVLSAAGIGIDIQSGVSNEQRSLRNQAMTVFQDSRKDGSSHAPIVSLSFSAAPDYDSYYYYSDWKHSWAQLLENPYLWDISISLNIKYSINTLKEKKLRNTLYQTQMEAIQNSLDDLKKKQALERIRLIEQIKSSNAYRESLTRGRAQEIQNSEDCDALYVKGLITAAEYFAGKAEAIAFEKELAEADWEYIESSLQLVILDGSNRDCNFIDNLFREN